MTSRERARAALERRASMLRPGDVAAAVRFVTTRPPRVTISDIVIRPAAGIHVV